MVDVTRASTELCKARQRKMDVPTHDTIGLNIYRELVGRENRSVGTWEKRYGKKVAVQP